MQRKNTIGPIFAEAMAKAITATRKRLGCRSTAPEVQGTALDVSSAAAHWANLAGWANSARAALDAGLATLAYHLHSFAYWRDFCRNAGRLAARAVVERNSCGLEPVLLSACIARDAKARHAVLIRRSIEALPVAYAKSDGNRWCAHCLKAGLVARMVSTPGHADLSCVRCERFGAGLSTSEVEARCRASMRDRLNGEHGQTSGA